MPPDPTARPSTRFSRGVRPLVLVGVAVSLAVGILAVPARSSLQAQQSGAGWTTDVVPGASAVARGNSISFALEVSSETNRSGYVDLEINDSAGRRVFQKFWHAQAFAARAPRTFTTTWAVPATAAPGGYVVRVNIVTVEGLDRWQHSAATFDIVATATATPTPTPTTTAPTPTVPAPTTTAPPTPTTTAAPTPTTAPPTTTVPTGPAPTTTPAPPTTQAPRGTQFSASFDSASDFYDRFDRGVSGTHPTVDPNHIRQWQGDHDMACGLPTTSRNVRLGANRDAIGEMFWWCAPAGAATGHVMTSLQTLGYNILWFSPARWLNNVSRVCWDQNTSFLGGRKWTQVTISSRAEVERVQRETGRLDLGFSHPGFQALGGPTTGIIPTNETVGLNFVIGFLTLWQGNHEIGSTGGMWKNEDVAKRYTMCAIDNGNNTITITQARPNNEVRTATYPGSFPDGEVRVAFHDANYDPPKDAEYDATQNTWHWDNIEIS